MDRLRNRTHHIPGSFRYLQPELGQVQEFVGSFNFVCEKVQQLRQANPFLCERHGLRTDIQQIEAEVDAYCAALCRANGWLEWIISDDAPMAVYVPPPEKKNRLAVVGAVRNVAAGIKLLVDWIGPTAKAVPQKLAEQRASICVSCPLNGKGGLLDYFTAEAAKTIQTQLEMKMDMNLRTSVDNKLGTCKACSCYLPLKVHVPIEFVLAHTSAEVKAALDPGCWVLSET